MNVIEQMTPEDARKALIRINRANDKIYGMQMGCDSD
jgi:hypothetical protein